jgi:hypothetical protein
MSQDIPKALVVIALNRDLIAAFDGKKGLAPRSTFVNDRLRLADSPGERGIP